MITVHFHTEQTDFQPDQPDLLKIWVDKLCNMHSLNPECINFIFCNDEYLLNINREYLNHDYLTDIITFQVSDDPLLIDIFISIDRVKDNAANLQNQCKEELLRVMAHGILHIAGYQDKTDDQSQEMRHMENKAIQLFNNKTY